MTFKLIQSFRNRNLESLFFQSNRHRAILERIRIALPSPLSSHVLDCAIRQNKLVIYTNSAAWSSQLRFYSREINSAAWQSGFECTDIHIRVALMQNQSVPFADPRAKCPSREQIVQIGKAATSLEGGELRQALLRLKATLQGLSQS